MTYHLKNIWKNKKKCPTKRASESNITHVSKLQGKQISKIQVFRCPLAISFAL